MNELKTNNNKQTYQFANDNEWYTYEKDVRDFLNIANISKAKTIWLPFDTDSSAFVKVLREEGYKFINSHIDMGGISITMSLNIMI